MKCLLRKEFEPSHAQLEFGDVDGTYPEWPAGDEPLVATSQKIAVATLPDFEGNAVLEVWEGHARDVPNGSAVLIHDGTISLSGEEAEAGTSLGGDLERVRVGAGEHRVQVFVDQPGYARRIVFLIRRRDS